MCLPHESGKQTEGRAASGAGGAQDEACPTRSHTAASLALPARYLHDGTELRLVLHLLLGDAPLHTGQDSGLEEVPPVVMERPEEELKQLSLHIWGGALRRHTDPQIFPPCGSGRPLTASAPSSGEAQAMPGNGKQSVSVPQPCCPVESPSGQQSKPGALPQRHDARVSAGCPWAKGSSSLSQGGKGCQMAEQ